MRASQSIVAAIAAAAVFSGSARAQDERGGFTLELSSRAGSFHSFQLEGDNLLEPAVAPLSISIGGFVSPRLALFGSFSAAFFNYSPTASTSAESRLRTNTTRALFLGATAQYWLSDSLTLGGGLGIGTLSHGSVEAEVNRGLAVPVRASWFFAKAQGGSLGATWELAPTFYSRGETALMSTFGLQWQWL